MRKYLNNRDNIIDTIRLLIYKESPKILEKVNLNDPSLFLNPLLFSYFNNKNGNLFPKEILEEIVQGYFIKTDKIKIKYSLNKNHIAYIPRIGYFRKDEQKSFMPIEIIKGTNIEVVRCSHPLIDVIFKQASDDKINDENLLISRKLFDNNIDYLTNAFGFIQRTSNAHYNLIEQNCKKCIVFSTNPSNTNSFATIKAHGMAFFNVYQEDYDEVFFVDDISHQTGHIILTSILFDRKRYFIIDENVNVKVITNIASEYRTFYTLFHALFTYYTTLMCFDNCIEGNCFDMKQLHEAKGRIGFYINKLLLDLENLNKIVNHYDGIENIFTQDGIEIYDIMKTKFSEIILKWYNLTKKYDFKNQPYNFTYQKFIDLNPMLND